MVNREGNRTQSAIHVRSRAQILNQFGTLLVEREQLSRERLEALEHRAAWHDEPIEHLLVREKVLPEADLLKMLSEITEIQVVQLNRASVDMEAVSQAPARTVVHYHVMPLGMKDGEMVVACDRVHDVTDEDRIRMMVGAPIRWVLCTHHEIAESINHFYGVGVSTFISLHPGGERPRGGTRTTAEGEAGENPDISAFVHEVIRDAIRTAATDIHFEPFEDTLRLRYRVDGVLYPIPLPPGVDRFARAVISSTKVMAQLNVAEHRLPQDGRFTVTQDEETFDVRVSVLPSHHGETVNMRFLNREATFLDLDQIGMRPDQHELLEHLIGLTHGLVLFTGPTGSGKTTSLYASLARLNQAERKIITIEDPVEYQIEGITQLQVHAEIGFSFASGLRSVLRHDPDVVLIGEIRDLETADIAVNAALTGHLVLSTLHTNDAPSAVTRLLDIGIEPYLVASSVEGLIAQRLVRRICPACKEPVELDRTILGEIRAAAEVPRERVFYRGRGCPNCRFTGYSGRQAIFEVLLMTDALRAMTVQRSSSSEMMRRAVADGLVTLRCAGWHCMLDGVTTVEDVLRVTQRTRPCGPGPQGLAPT